MATAPPIRDLLTLSTPKPPWNRSRPRTVCPRCGDRPPYGAHQHCLWCIRAQKYDEMTTDQQRQFRGQYIPKHFIDAALEDLSEGVRGQLKYIADKKGLYCWGAVGIGKTHLLAAIAGDILRRGGRLAWTTLEALATALRGAYHHESSANEEKIFAAVLEAEHLFLDDLGLSCSDDGRVSDFMNRVLYRVLDTRVHQDLPVYISSNKPAAEVEKNFDARIGSRLHMLHVLPLTGPDRRRTRK